LFFMSLSAKTGECIKRKHNPIGTVTGDERYKKGEGTACGLAKGKGLGYTAERTQITNSLNKDGYSHLSATARQATQLKRKGRIL